MTEGQSDAELRRLAARAISQPLVTHIYTADPSAHVFDGRLYVYPSHDIDAGIPFDDDGSHFGMQDYHVLRMEAPDAEAVDCGVALHIRDVPWAERQMWAPDAATKAGRYYLYFPAKRRRRPVPHRRRGRRASRGPVRAGTGRDRRQLFDRSGGVRR